MRRKNFLKKGERNSSSSTMRLLFRQCHTLTLNKQMLNLRRTEKNFNLILYMPQTCLVFIIGKFMMVCKFIYMVCDDVAFSGSNTNATASAMNRLAFST